MSLKLYSDTILDMEKQVIRKISLQVSHMSGGKKPCIGSLIFENQSV